MMRLRTLLIALLLAGPPLPALAQSGPEQGVAKGEHHGKRHGPVEKLIRHRAELQLTDEQVARLQEINQRLEEQNRPAVGQLMAIRREMLGDGPRIHPREMTEEQRAELKRFMGRARPLLDQIGENNRAAMRVVGDVLTSEQRARLREMLRKHRERNGRPDSERQHNGRGPGG